MITLQNSGNEIPVEHLKHAHDLLNSMVSPEIQGQIAEYMKQNGGTIQESLKTIQAKAKEKGLSLAPLSEHNLIKAAHDQAKDQSTRTSLTIWNEKGQNITKPKPPKPAPGADLTDDDTPSAYDVLSTWETAITDSIFFVINLTALGSLASKGTKYEFKVEESKASKMKSMLEDISSKVATHHAEMSVTSWLDAMEAIVMFLFTILHEGIKSIIEAIREASSTLDWILHGIVALAQIAIWFATDGLALICQLVIVINSGYETLEAWEKVKGTGSDFLKYLFDDGGEIHNHFVRVIREDYNPALINYKNTIFRFQKSINNGISYSWITVADLQALISAKQALHEQASNLGKASPGEINIDPTTLPKWSSLIPISNLGNNSSSPAAIVSQNNQLVVAYRSNTTKGYHWFTQISMENLYQNLVNNKDDFAISEWTQPIQIDSAWGHTAPTLDYNSYTEFLHPQATLIFQGEQGNMWICTWNGTGFDPARGLKEGTTATTPTTCGNKTFNIVVFHTSAMDNDYLYIYATYLALGFDSETMAFPPSVNSTSSPAFAINWNGIPDENQTLRSSIYYLGEESPAKVWKHSIPLDSISNMRLWDKTDDDIFYANPTTENDKNGDAYTSVSSPRFVNNDDASVTFMFISSAPGVFKAVQVTV